ncbi:MAG: rubrerythrin family protein [Candidatus Methanofastidiosia archaeon]
MRSMTEKNLRDAFAGESQAHIRYLIFADKAKEEGNPNIARLFDAIAFAEQVHATNHFKTLGDLGMSAENLQAAINGETYEVEEMYPAFREVAKLQEEKGAQKSTLRALEAEKVHAGMYEKARQAVVEGRDLSVGKIHICSECGWTMEGEAPDKCPLCGASSEKFREF